jgi:two-component system, chemotaxis family, sensor kinase CheA
MDQTQREFLVEIEELVEQIFFDLDELRATRSNRHRRRQLIDSVFRCVHSIKGLSATLDLDAVTHLAHEFENLLAAARSGSILLDKETLELCESATNALSESLNVAAGDAAEGDQRSLFDRLHAATAGTVRPVDSFPSDVPTEISSLLSDAEMRRLANLIDEGNSLFQITARFDLANFDEGFSRLKNELSETGEVVSTSPSIDPEDPGKIGFRLLYAGERDQLNKLLDIKPEVVANEIPTSREGSSNFREAAGHSMSSSSSVSSSSNFVRTDLDKLNLLISSTHELFRTTSNAFDRALAQQQTTPAAAKELRQLQQQIRAGFLSVEDELINLRMVPLGPTLQRAVRAGRAAARQSKQVDFVITGTDLRLDKMIVDAIADPLIHLVRNAVDHGIETAEERTKAGKKASGVIRIDAFTEGSQSRVRVTDDGSGIDPGLISEAAKRLGLSPADCALDLERCLRLIFRPGFTTLAAASDLSGRGVGLDIVETAVEQVGGGLRVSSKPGVGSTFEILLPVTFGLLNATVVVSAGNRYCIPSDQVIGSDASRDLFEMPKVDLHELLHGDGDASRREPARFVCVQVPDPSGANRNHSRRACIGVDEVLASEEILVRNLGRHAARWFGVAGATELVDGSVALVLDLSRLLSPSQ